MTKGHAGLPYDPAFSFQPVQIRAVSVKAMCAALMCRRRLTPRRQYNTSLDASLFPSTQRGRHLHWKVVFGE